MTTLTDRPVAPPPRTALADVRADRRRRSRRTARVLLGLAVVLVALSVTSLSVGEFAVPPGDLLAALVGQADGGTSL